MTAVAKSPAQELQELLAGTSTTLADVLNAIVAQQPTTREERRALPPIPTFSPEQKKALSTIAKRAEAFDFPTQSRILTEDERKNAIEIFVQLKTAAKALGNLEDAFKATFHGHLDIELEAAKRAKGVDQDQRGNYVADGDITAPGLAEKVARETRGGGAAALTLADLQSLVANEAAPEWTHEEFLATTDQVRVVSTTKIMDRVKKNPKLLDGLKKVARLTPKTTQLAVRPVKTSTAKK